MADEDEGWGNYKGAWKHTRVVLEEVEETDSEAEDDEIDENSQVEAEIQNEANNSAIIASQRISGLGSSFGHYNSEEHNRNNRVIPNSDPSASESNHPFMTPGLTANIQRALAYKYDLRDTAKWSQNPLLPDGRVGFMAPLAGAPIVDRRRMKRHIFDPNFSYRNQQLREQQEIIERFRLQRKLSARRPLLVKTAGPPRRPRVVPQEVPDEPDLLHVPEESSESDGPFRGDSDEEDRFKRSKFENSQIPIFVMGKPASEPNVVELRHAELKPRESVIDVIRKPKANHVQPEAELMQVDPTDASENLPKSPVKGPVLENKSSSDSTSDDQEYSDDDGVDQQVVEEKSSVVLGFSGLNNGVEPVSKLSALLRRHKETESRVLPRRCRFPSKTSPYINHWNPQVSYRPVRYKEPTVTSRKLRNENLIVEKGREMIEPGVVPVECSCSFPPLDIPFDQLDWMIPEKRCQACCRDEDLNLVRCVTHFDELEKLEYYWLPQTEQIGAFCRDHAALLRAHKICPFCNEFFSRESQEAFAVCRGQKGSSTHLYHLGCRKVMNVKPCCPHCLLNKAVCIELAFDGVDRQKSFYLNEGVDSSGLTDGLRFETISFPDSWNIPDLKSYFAMASLQEADDEIYLITVNAVEKLLPKDDQILLFIHRVLNTEKQNSLRDLDEDGNSLLHLAARTGNVPAILVLTAIGLDVNLGNATAEKDTPLLMAVKKGHAGAIYALVKAGADMNYQDPVGHTALHWAAYHRNYPAVYFLLVNGANSEIRDCDGFTFVFSTIDWITEKQLNSLAGKHVDLKVIDRDGWTLLHWIAMLGRNDLAQLFLDHELVCVKGTHGETPLHVAAVFDNTGFIDVFTHCRKPHLFSVDVSAKLKLGILKFADGLNEQGYLSSDKMMEKLTCLDTKSNAIIGEVSGDITNGKAFLPIPCYNFENTKQYPEHLVYSDIVVKPIFFQFPARVENISHACPPPPEDVAGKAKRTRKKNSSSGPIHSCEGSSMCSCMSRPKGDTLNACEQCDKDGNITDFHSCPIMQEGRMTSQNGGTTSCPRLPLPVAHARNLVQRLSRKSAFSSSRLADDLNYISDLVKHAHLPECRKRPRVRSGDDSRKWYARSVPPQRRNLPKLRRLESCPPYMKRADRDWEVRTEIFVDRYGNEHAIPTDDPLVPETTDFSKPAKKKIGRPKKSAHRKASAIDSWWDNPLDLFAEIQEFKVDGLIRGAMVWFERRHFFERWDLSSFNKHAPSRHPKTLFPRWHMDSFAHFSHLAEHHPKSERQSKNARIWAKTKSQRAGVGAIHPMYLRKSLHFPSPLPTERMDEEHELYPSWLRVGGMLIDWQIESHFECTVHCACSGYCSNRISEIPTTTRIALKYYGHPVGWGVMALARILGGEPIAEYTGEIILEESGNGGSFYGDDSYMYQLDMTFLKPESSEDELSEPQMAIDAMRVGNIARFLNHSCNPNCIGVQISPHGMREHKLVLFAVKTIYPTEQLTLDYMDGWWEGKGNDDTTGEFYCRCGETTCRYGRDWAKKRRQKKGCTDNTN